MREVTKEEFKEAFFTLGGRESSGWSLEYWNKFFEDDMRLGMTYRLQDPETPQHTRMMIVSDFDRSEYRLFFLTEEGEESLFDFPAE